MTIYLSEVEVLVQFVDSLKKAASSAHAMAHYQENPNWLKIRDNLETMIVYGQKMAVAKSMPRQEVLRNLDLRKLNAPKDVNGN